MTITQLSPIKLSSLRNPEAGQLINRFFEDFTKSDIDVAIDADFKRLFDSLKAQIAIYSKALDQIKAQEETGKIAELDTERDEAVQALKFVLKSYQSTKIEAEKQAFNALQLILNQYKGVENDSYEQETLRLNNLITLLTNTENSGHIKTLGIEKFVMRLADSNKSFNDVFANRSHKIVIKEVYDVKVLKKELLAVYVKMANYTESLAIVKENTPFYKDVLSIFNNSRKYFADVIAKRGGKK